MATKKSNKLLYYLLGAVGVIIVFAIIGKSAGWIGGAKETEVEFATVKKTAIIEKVSASGEIQPEVEVKLSPDVAGEIIELNVQEGDSVEMGRLLVKIRPDNFVSALDRTRANLNQQMANLAQSKASLQRAEAQFTRSELDFKRQKTLHDSKAISDADYEQAVANYITAQKDLEAAKQSVIAAEFIVKSSQASVNEASENLRLTNVNSPVSGIVSSLKVEQGERVVGTQQMAGTEMMTIADLSRMEVRVDVNENDIVKINIGDETNIQVDAYLKKEFKGIVTSISNSASTALTADQVTNFKVKVRILKESYMDLLEGKSENFSPFRPGMTATVDIITKRKENIVAVPISAVVIKDDTTSVKKDVVAELEKKEQEQKGTAPKSDKKYECVFVKVGDRAKLRVVKTGIQDDSNIEIMSGLKPGEEIIIGPYTTVSKDLVSNDKVRVESEKDKKENKK